MSDKHRSKQKYLAFCPACREEVIERRPYVARRTMAFKCKCGCEFTVKIDPRMEYGREEDVQA